MARQEVENNDTGLLSRTKINENDAELYIGAETVAADQKTTPVDADVMPIQDSAAANIKKKVTWANIKATLKTYFDGLYGTLAATNLNTDKVSNEAHTGDVTGATALTIGAKKVLTGMVADEAINTLQLATKYKGNSVISAVEIDWDLDQVRTKTITGNTTFTFANLYIGVKTLQITGSFTIAFPAGFDLMDGSQAYDGTKVNWIDIICSDTGTPLGMINIYFKA